jgi:hypothetical protein
LRTRWIEENGTEPSDQDTDSLVLSDWLRQQRRSRQTNDEHS